MVVNDPGAWGHLNDVLSALLDGELDDAGMTAARAHLAGCPTCEEELVDVGLARSWLRSLPPVEPPADFYHRLLAAAPERAHTEVPSPFPGHGGTVTSVAHAHRRQRHRHRWQAGVVAMSACAAATLVVLGIAAPHEPSTSPPLGRFIAAHETEVGGGDPVTELATATLPAGFGR